LPGQLIINIPSSICCFISPEKKLLFFFRLGGHSPYLKECCVQEWPCFNDGEEEEEEEAVWSSERSKKGREKYIKGGKGETGEEWDQMMAEAQQVGGWVGCHLYQTTRLALAPIIHPSIHPSIYCSTNHRIYIYI